MAKDMLKRPSKVKEILFMEWNVKPPLSQMIAHFDFKVRPLIDFDQAHKKYTNFYT